MIYLEKVYLNNWYGFTDEMIPFSKGSTFVTGENESGKSTILDAIKYAFMSDTQFNKGAANSGKKKRTLASYTRCLYNPSEGLYARNEEVIFSHVFLGWFDSDKHERFTTGCIIRTRKEDTSTHWFILEERIENIAFQKTENGQTSVLNYNQFKTANAHIEKIHEYSSWAEARENFFYRYGMPMSPAEIDKYRDAMRRMVAYKPSEMSIVSFISEFVLKEDPVSMTNLLASKLKYDELRANMDKLEREAEALKKMKSTFEAYQASLKKQEVNNYKIMLESCQAKEKAIEAERTACSRNEIELKEAERKLKEIDENLESIRNQLKVLENEQRNSDGAEQINMLNDQIRKAENAVRECKESIEQITSLQNYLREIHVSGNFNFDLLNLTDEHIPSSEKEEYLINTGDIFDSYKLTFASQIAEKDEKIKEVNTKIEAVTKEIDNLQNNGDIFDSKATNAIKLQKAINRKLESMGRDSRAYLAADLVVELTDESWRKALEAYIGSNRYSILVEPRDYKIASEVQQELRLPYAKLINTIKLENKHIDVDDESVVKYMRIENSIAQKYFDYLLGNVHEATHETAFNHTPSLCKDLYYTRDLFSDYMRSVEVPRLGMGAKKINLEKKRGERTRLIKEREALFAEKNEISDKLNIAKTVFTRVNKTFDFSAFETNRRNSLELNTLRLNLESFKRALNSNSAHFKLLEQIEDCRKKEDALRVQQRTVSGRIGSCEDKQKAFASKIKYMEEELAAIVAKMQECERAKPEVALIAKKEYESYIQNGKNSKGIANNNELSMKVGEAKNKLTDEKARYIHTYGANLGGYVEMISALEDSMDFEFFDGRLDYLAIDEIQKAKKELNEEQDHLTTIFKEEFAAEIFSKAESANAKLRGMNKELANLSFNTEYQFVSKYLNDGSHFATIIEYAKESKKMHQKQYELDGNCDEVDYEKLKVLDEKIIALINSIATNSDDKDKMDQLSDYRNYMTYDISQQDKKTGQKGLLSKENGYHSGAGTQIPYTIILSVGLAMEYNREEGASTVRLIMLDEPFEKMSSENIKRTMELFRELKLQPIFCSASKMDSIGEASGAIIPVLKIDRQHMTVGVVEEKEIEYD